MEWKKIRKEINHFFAQEYFTDALRVTLSTLLPVSLLFFYGMPQVAIAVGLGSMSMSFTDSPGTVREKVLSFVVSLVLFSVIPAVTSLSLFNPVATAVVIGAFTFLLSMLNVYGNRFSLIGTSATILMIFVFGFKPANIVAFTAYLIAGGVWYYFISLLQAKLWPFRSMQHAIGECLKATAVFLDAKAPFYDPKIPLAVCYDKIVVLHAQVNEKQEHMRNVVLKNNAAMGVNNVKGQLLLKITSGVIDLYEQVTSIHYDYEMVRQSLKESGALELIVNMTHAMAAELNLIGENLRSNRSPDQKLDFLNRMELMEARLYAIIEKENNVNAGILTRLRGNINEVFQQIQELKTSLLNRDPQAWQQGVQPDYNHFYYRQEFSLKQLKSHLNFHSPIFRFSVRLSIACLFAFALAFILPLGNYSYWIMLTIVVIMKPGFSLTKKRNSQRFFGTIIGILVGLLLLASIKIVAVQLFLCMVFLLGFFAFNKSNYTVSVVFITAMVIVSLDIYNNHQNMYILERIIDTVIGCVIALLASYVFPVWEVQKLNTIISEVLEVNINYLEKLTHKFSGQQVSVTTYKLSRKNVFIKLASLSTAIQNMLLEPQKLSFNIKNVYRFQMLAHQLYGTIASFFITDAGNSYDAGYLESTREAINNLKDCLTHLHTQQGIGYTNDDHEQLTLLPLANHDALKFNHYQVQLLLNITAELKKQFKA